MQIKTGRPRAYVIQDVPLSKITITVTEWHKRQAQKMAPGNASLAFRSAMEIAALNTDPLMADLSKIIPAVHSAYMTLGAALTEEQQTFVLQHWKTFPDFMKTDVGKLAIQTCVSDWMASKNHTTGANNQ